MCGIWKSGGKKRLPPSRWHPLWHPLLVGGGPFHALNESILRNSKKTIKGICPQMPPVLLVPIFAKGKTVHLAFWVLVHIHCLILFMEVVFPFLGTKNQEKIER